MSLTLHIDSHTGISGDRMIGALCALGLRPSALEWELSKLPIGDFHMHFERVGEGVRFTIHEGATHRHDAEGEGHCCEGGHDHGHAHHHHGDDHDDHDHEGDCCGHHAHGDHDHHHDHQEQHPLPEIRAAVAGSDLSPFVRERACAILQRLEAVTPQPLTSGERLEWVARIVGTCVGLEQLGVATITASPLRESRETAREAVLTLLAGLPLERTDDPHPLFTPEGAAIVAELVSSFSTGPTVSGGTIGIGIGETCGCSQTPATLTLLLGSPA